MIEEEFAGVWTPVLGLLGALKDSLWFCIPAHGADPTDSSPFVRDFIQQFFPIFVILRKSINILFKQLIFVTVRDTMIITLID